MNAALSRMNIILTGMMGSGKSEVGRRLAGKLNMKFFDMDENLVKTTGMKINDIFERKGEAWFRRLERNLVHCVCLLNNQVVSTGGGVVLDKRNISDFRKNGTVFYLKAEPEVLFERVRTSKSRPLLKVENPLTELKIIYRRRKKLYGNCDFKIITDGRGIDDVCAEIISKIKKKP
ncbi:MAG: shikimate kinase [bacterium]